MECRSRNGRLVAILCVAATLVVWFLLEAGDQDMAAGLLTGRPLGAQEESQTLPSPTEVYWHLIYTDQK
jgi:hypothetical protein